MSGDSARGLETAERLLDAALPVFSAHGYAGASTRTLAGAAGVNIATIAYHFRDKQGLYDAVVDRIYDRLLQVDPGPPEAWGDTPRARVMHLVGVLADHARAHADGIRLLLRHVMEHRGSPERVLSHWGQEVSARAGGLLGPLGLDPDQDHRLALLSLNHLIARYAVTEDADLLAWADDPTDPRGSVRRHLGEVACRLLGVE